MIEDAAEGRLGKSGDRVYLAVYRALLVGMTVSNLLFASGIALGLAKPGLPGSSAVVPEPFAAFSWKLLRAGNPLPLYATATAILILTPIVRVAVSIVAFVLDRDYRFALVASVVLGVVLVAILSQIVW